MKQVNIHGPGDVKIDDVPEPEPGPRDAIVKVAACGICGSDVGYIAAGGLMGPTGQPMPIGHEFAGTVEAIGSEVTGVEVGARVVVNPISGENTIGNGADQGAFAPRVLVPNAADGHSIHPIPDSLPMDVAALAEPLSVGLQAVDQTKPQPGERAVVFGAGPIGLAAVAGLRFRGVEDIVSIDLSAGRLEIARKLGARATLDPSRGDVYEALRELHGTVPVYGAPMVGSDIFIEASGAGVVIEQAIANAKPDARISIVALHRNPVSVNFMIVMMKQLQIVGSMGYPEDWSDALELLQGTDLSPMITHRFVLDDFHEALDIARQPDAGAKVMIVNAD